jgi:hypothetical protein
LPDCASAPTRCVSKAWRDCSCSARARGDARPDSDLDVLVELRPDRQVTLNSFLEIGYICEEASGISTQVTLRNNDLKPRFIERIADDLTVVF